MITLCLHLSIQHLTLPTKVQLGQLASAVYQEAMLTRKQWPRISVSTLRENGYFITVPELVDEIVHSHLPHDLKEALQVACELGIGLLRIDTEGAHLQQLHYYGD